MASFNKVFLMGNLTRDPELRVTNNGLSICKFAIASTRSYTGQDGSLKEEVTFVDVDAFGKQAEVLSKYLNKGKPIFIEGRLKLDQWESQTGEKRSRLGVILESFQFIGPKSGGGGSAGSGEGAGIANESQYEAVTPPVRKQEVAVSVGDDIDEDVPF